MSKTKNTTMKAYNKFERVSVSSQTLAYKISSSINSYLRLPENADNIKKSAPFTRLVKLNILTEAEWFKAEQEGFKLTGDWNSLIGERMASEEARLLAKETREKEAKKIIEDKQRAERIAKRIKESATL